jgi:alpha-methylacyl-CoA racemase
MHDRFPSMSHTHSPTTALQGVRIVSLAQNLPGPLAVSRLVEAGAVARKVEPPAGDPMRALSPAWYSQLHRYVAVEMLDLKTADGRARLSALLDEADLLIASQRPSALGRLGLDPDTLAMRHPHLRGLTIVGDTRAPETPGHDLTYQATAGLLDRDMPRTLLADIMGAERAVTTALLLLRHAAPAHVCVGLRDALESVAAPLQFGLTTGGATLAADSPPIACTTRARVAWPWRRSNRISATGSMPRWRYRLGLT